MLPPRRKAPQEAASVSSRQVLWRANRPHAGISGTLPSAGSPAPTCLEEQRAAEPRSSPRQLSGSLLLFGTCPLLVSGHQRHRGVKPLTHPFLPLLLRREFPLPQARLAFLPSASSSQCPAPLLQALLPQHHPEEQTLLTGTQHSLLRHLSHFPPSLCQD